MVWTTFAKITLDNDWIYTSPVEGSYFRIIHGDYPGNSSFLLSQFDENGKVFGHTIVKTSLFREVLHLPKPKLATNRRLGFKLISAIPWDITIQVSDYIEPTPDNEPGVFSLLQDVYTETIEINQVIEDTLLVDTYTINNKLNLLLERVSQGRKAISITTPVISPGGIHNTTISLGKAFILLSVATSSAAWLRLYTSPSYRTADTNRLISRNPNSLENGIISEDITNNADLSIDLTGNGGFQGIGSSQETPPNSEIAIAIVNLSGTSQAITVTYNRILLEP